MRNRHLYIIGSLAAIFALWLVASNTSFFNNTTEEPVGQGNALIDTTCELTEAENITDTAAGSQLQRTFSDADLDCSTIDLSKVLSGGVAKDGIPAISNPKFVDISSVERPDETLGILVELDGEKRFYPYNILVSHEIVNDSIGDNHFAVTFCPLCGSAIVFDRNLDSGLVEFGVSGFLFESNLIMYDRTSTPSLWSQARGEAVIGDQAGTALDLVPFDLLQLGDAKNLHPDAMSLSEDTGFARSYDFDPYSGYDEEERIWFETSVADSRFFAKEIFFIVPKDEQSVAIKIDDLDRGQSATSEEFGLTVAKTNDGELNVTNENGEEQTGYYEMWFSWVQHHQDDGAVWEPVVEES